MMLNVHCYLGISVFVQKQESGIPIDQPFLFRMLSVGNDIFQSLINIIRHGNEPAAAFRLCFLHIIGTIRLADQLVVYLYSSFFKIQLLLCQTAHFADTHPRFQKYHEFIIVTAVMRIILDEVHKDIFLLLG